MPEFLDGRAAPGAGQGSVEMPPTWLAVIHCARRLFGAENDQLVSL
jgi:hypothetical protein